MPSELKQKYLDAGGKDIPNTSYMTPFGSKSVQIWNPAALVQAISDAGQKPREWWQLVNEDDVSYLFEEIVKDAVSTVVIKDRRMNVLQLLETTVTDRIKLSGWEISDEESKEFKEKMEELDDELGLMRLSDDIFSRAEIQGQTFLIVWPGRDKEPGLIRSTPATTVVGYPDDGHSIWPEWAARLSAKGTRLDLFLEDRVITWKKRNIAEELEGQMTPVFDFSPQLSDTVQAGQTPAELTVTNVWGEPEKTDYNKEWPKIVPVVPFVSTKLTAPVSAIKPAIGCQRALDHGMAIDTVSMELASFPIRYSATKPGEGDASEADLSRASDPDNDFDFDTDDADQDTLDLKPGCFIDFEADIVGQFDAAPPSATLDRLAFYAKTALVLCGLPLSVWEGTTANNSGELMRRELHSLLSKVRSRINAYRAAYRRVWRLLIAQNGLDREIIVKPVFDDPAMPDELYIWELVTLKLDAGLPMEQALLEAGVPQEIIDKIDTERIDNERRGLTADGDGNPGSSGTVPQSGGSRSEGRRSQGRRREGSGSA